MIAIAIHGAAGRMGQRLIALLSEDSELGLSAAIEQAGNPRLGEDAGLVAGTKRLGVPVTDHLGGPADVLIDFTGPQATRVALQACVDRKLAMVIGTTGLGDDDQAAIDQAARVIPVLQAPNMSLGVNLLLALAARAAKTLGDAYDIEIIETHHRFKKDAPSGTALGIAAAICNATGKDMNHTLKHGRRGDDPRKPGEIGMHAVRGGDVVGRHTASFCTLGEELQLTHMASSRDVFAQGALRAAKWLAGRKNQPGRYTMAHVLGL
jgi:4-hydroxy-tetrahydrodipicolinate reductase